MSVEMWIYRLLPLATSVIVPLGILLHYWRAADARPLPAVSDHADAAAWSAATRAQLRRARIASAVVTVAALASTFGVIVPYRFGTEWNDFLTPLLSALLCTAVLLARPPAAGGVDTPAASADSTAAGGRRGLSTVALGEPWWFIAGALCLAALVLAVCWAGLASSTDDNGNYTMHSYKFEDVTAGTSIAGWYFGIPVIIAAVLLTALVLFALRLQAAPPLAVDGGRDLLLRRAATRTLLSLGVGAVVVTLAWVLLSIGSAAQLTISVPSADDGGMTTLDSPLAPISIPARVLGLLLQGIGIALLMLPLLSRRAPRAEAATTEAPTLEHDEAQSATS